ncbi:AAA family ATPase, partial [archaeon SCG-AAA382B04]
WVGESEKGVREIFKKARQTAPTVLFFDEIDSIAPKRGGGQQNRVTERVVNQLLTEMDGMEGLEDVVIVAATNRPDIIDPALLRSGRFDRRIYIPVPDKQSREKILEVHTQEMPLADDVDLERLATQLEGYVGSDIQSLTREAAMLALRDDMETEEIKNKYFQEAMEEIHPTADEDTKEYYMKMEEKLKGSPETVKQKDIVGYR